MNELTPALTPDLPQIAAPLTELPTALVSDSEADAAAAELGMVFFSAAKARNLKKLGIFRGQQNVVHLGVGRLAACDDALNRLLDASVSIAEDTEEDVNQRVGAVMAGKGIVEVIQAGIKMEAEFHTEKLLTEPRKPRQRSFDTDDKPIIPLQANAGSTININVDGGRDSGNSRQAT